MIRVGVAGWDYPDWNGRVYPARPGARFDRLAYLSDVVDVVEVNSTFYRPADPRMAASWVRRTEGPSRLRFTAKAHRSWTHEDAPSAEAIRSTLDGLAPLREARRLAALLLQFPQRFHRTAASLDRLERLREATAGWPAVVEVRHVSWDRPDAEAWFRERGLGWCVVDQPRVGASTAPPRPRVTSAVAYLRLHGRNAANWFREGVGRDARYDYLYSRDELGELADSARAMAEASEELIVVQNNHFRGQALANALQMKALLQEGPVSVPETLARAYPELEDTGTSPQGRLF